LVEARVNSAAAATMGCRHLLDAALRANCAVLVPEPDFNIVDIAAANVKFGTRIAGACGRSRATLRKCIL
jgi:hypothetical protein